MINIVNYIVEANLALIIFLGVYTLVLSRENNFRLMRICLLTGVFVSLILPLISFEYNDSDVIPSLGRIIPSNWLPEVIIFANNTSSVSETATFVIWKTAGMIYLTGILVFLTVLLYQVIQIFRTFKKSNFYKIKDIKIAESDDNTPTFSFFNYIFIGNADSLSEKDKQQIIRHEMAHSSQFHSFDILLINVVQIVFWFNPLMRYYKNYFVQIHEFEADARAVENGDENKYCSLLAKVALQSADFSLANYFNNSLTVKRITMIRTIKQKVSKWKLAAVTAVFPLLFFLLGFQDQVFAQTLKTKAEVSSSNDVYEEVDELPSYGKGFEDVAKFLGSNMKYPKQAKDNNVEGTVFTEFVVEKDGKLSDIKIKEGIGNGCDDEALRVVRAMPAWNPGMYQGKIVRTRMVLPIKFKLN